MGCVSGLTYMLLFPSQESNDNISSISHRGRPQACGEATLGKTDCAGHREGVHNQAEATLAGDCPAHLQTRSGDSWGASGAPGIDGKSEGPARTGRAAAGGARPSRSLAPGPRVTPLSSPVAAKGSGARGGPVNSVPKSCPSPSWLVAGPHVPASFATRCGHRTKPEPLPDSATCGQGPEPGQAALASVLCEDGWLLAECFCASTSCF